MTLKPTILNYKTLVLHCLLLFSRLVSQAELYRWLLTWKLNLTGLIYFTSGYSGKNTSAPSKDFLQFSACLVSGSTAACSEAHGGWLPTDFSPTSRLPSQFLPASRCHRSFLRLPRVPGGPSGRAEAPAGAPLQRVPFSSPCPPGRPQSSLPCAAARFRFWTRSVTCQ